MKTLLSLLVLSILLAGCASPQTATNKEAQTVESQDLIYLNGQPIPLYNYSPERDVFIQLYNFRMSNVSTWTVICSNMGNCLDSCPSLGYPMPADVQLTNPLKGDLYNPPESGWEVITVEQREPNGLFSSKNTAGTWVLCVYGEGRVEPVYTELNATAYAHPVKVVNGVIVHDLEGNPSAILDVSKLNTNQGQPIQYQKPISTEVPAP